MTWNARLVQIQITLVFYLEEALSLYGGRPLRSHHPEIAEEENAILAYKQADIAKQKKDSAFQLKQFVIRPMFPSTRTVILTRMFDRNFKNLTARCIAVQSGQLSLV